MDKRATVRELHPAKTKKKKRKKKGPGFPHHGTTPGKMAGGQLTGDVPGRGFQDYPDAEFAPPHHAPTPNTCC